MDAMSVRLQQYRLGQYADKCCEKRFHSVEEMQDRDEHELEQAMKDIGVKSGHRMRFKAAFDLGQEPEKRSFDPEVLKSWLSVNKLDYYLSNFEENGYDDLQEIVDLNPTELDGFARIVGIKKGHQKRLRDALHKFRSSLLPIAGPHTPAQDDARERDKRGDGVGIVPSHSREQEEEKEGDVSSLTSQEAQQPKFLPRARNAPSNASRSNKSQLARQGSQPPMTTIDEDDEDCCILSAEMSSSASNVPYPRHPLIVVDLPREALVCQWSSFNWSSTYTFALDFLLGLNKGALIVIYDVKGGEAANTVLPTCPSNNLVDVFDAYAPRLLSSGQFSPVFLEIARAYESIPHEGDNGDKWACHIVEKLADNLANRTGEPAADIKKVVMELDGQPADGAFVVLSLRGKVVAANCQINWVATHEVLRSQQKLADTRHANAVAAVEWMKKHNLEGMALVRSDAGSVTAVSISKGQIKAQQVQGR